MGFARDEQGSAMRERLESTATISRVAQDGAVGVVTIAGEGPQNLLTPEACLGLDAALRELDERDDLRVGLLVGRGGSFCGGFDEASLERNETRFQDSAVVFLHRYYPLLQDEKSTEAVWPTLLGRRTRKPVVAAVAGPCLDIGLAILGVHSDIRVASTDARFGLPGVHAGTTPGLAIASRLAEQVPRSLFNWLVETGLEIDADAALRGSLVSAIVQEDAHAAAERIASDIARYGWEIESEKQGAMRHERDGLEGHRA